MLTFACYLVSIQPNEVRLLVGKDSPHEACTVHVLLRTPYIPRILTVMQVRKDGDLERAIRTEGQTGLVWIRVQLSWHFWH